MGRVRDLLLSAWLLLFVGLTPAADASPLPGGTHRPIAKPEPELLANADSPEPIARDRPSTVGKGGGTITLPPVPVGVSPYAPRDGWPGYVGALERYVRLSIDRASVSRPGEPITTPPTDGPRRDDLPPGAIRPPGDARGGDEPLPTRLAFGLVSPNPTRGPVLLRVELPAAARVRIAILDVAGRVIHEIRETREAGRHAFAWDAGPMVRSAGIYFAYLEVDGRRIGSRRMAVLR